jgi:hypothetical protein
MMRPVSTWTSWNFRDEEPALTTSTCKRVS